MTASPRAIAHIHAAAKEAGIGATPKESHAYLHAWAVDQGYNSLTDFTDDELDGMARKIKADPEVMAAWFDAFEPIEWEAMDVAENAEPGDPSVLSSLFSAEDWATLHAASDAIQRKNRWTA